MNAKRNVLLLVPLIVSCSILLWSTECRAQEEEEKDCVLGDCSSTQEDCCYSSLLQALYADCTHIRVQPGTYRGPENQGLCSEKLLELTGLGNTESVVFDMQWEDHFLSLSAPRSPQHLLLSNLTIQNSYSPSQGALVLHNYELTAHHVYFAQNYFLAPAISLGGAALLLEGQPNLRSELHDCVFANNTLATTPDSQGALGTTVAAYDADLFVSRCIFAGNAQQMILEEYEFMDSGDSFSSSSSDRKESDNEIYGGGTLFFWGSGSKRITVKHSLFLENQVEQGIGGALFLWDVDTTRATLHNNIFVRNGAAAGGALAAFSPLDTPLDCAHNRYEGNTAHSSYAPTLQLDDKVCSDYTA